MSAQGLLMMVVTEGVITAITVYFFWKVLTTPPHPDKPEPNRN